MMVPRDFDARLRVQTQFDRVLVVEAGAGTGKTSILTARILYWLLEPGWNLALRRTDRAGSAGYHDIATDVMARVMALTFTEAAAAEMRLRILEGLRTVASRRAPGPSLLVSSEFLEDSWDEYAARAQALVAASHRLSATTIHAFCNRLLLAHPLEAGLHPLPRVDAEEEEVEELVGDFVAEEFVPLYESEDRVVRETVLGLVDRGIGPSLVSRLLRDMARHAVSAGALARLDGEPGFFDLDWFHKNVFPLADPLAELVQKDVGTVRRRSARADKALAAVRNLPTRLAASLSGLDAMDAFDELFSDETVKHWLKDDFATQHEQALRADCPELFMRLQDLRRLRDRAVLGPLKEVVFPIARRLENELSRRGLLTYDALLRRAADLLGSHPDLAWTLRREMDLVVIDEFQDTDQVQCEIVTRLALDGKSRPSLMLVGDPKQSIYGFRSADLEAYDDFVARVIEQGGERLVLEANFRSHEAILREVDKLVRPVMHKVRGIQPGFQPLEAAARVEPVIGEKRRPVEYWVFPVEGRKTSGRKKNNVSVAEGPLPILEKRHAADQALVEADAIAADVAALHADGVAWKDMALLLRSTTHLDTFLQALDRHLVPYVTSSSKGYYQREEVVLAVSLVQAVLDWDDHMSLISVLRSLLSGLPDAAIAPLWLSGKLASKLADLAESREAVEEQNQGCCGKNGPEPDAVDGTAMRREKDLWADLVAMVTATAGDLAGLPGMDRIEGWEKSVLHFLDALTRLRVSFRRRTTDRFLEELRNFCGLELLQVPFVDGPRRLANLQALFDDLRDAMEDTSDPRALLRTLRGWLDDSSQGEVDRPDTVADALSVLTIHGAKGLGFGHLYVANLGADLFDGRRGTSLEFLPYMGGWQFRVDDFETDRWREADDKRQEKERAEVLRLFYVAATRARSRVVFVGSWPLPDEGRVQEGGVQAYRQLLSSRPVTGCRGEDEDCTMGAWVWSRLCEEAGRLQKGAWDDDVPVLLDGTLEGETKIRCVIFSPSSRALAGLEGKWPSAGASSSVISSGEEGFHADLRGRVASLVDARRKLEKKRDDAILRMARHLSCGPSRLAGQIDFFEEVPAEELAVSFEEGAVDQTPGTVGSQVLDEADAALRQIAGLLVHGALESWDETRDSSDALESACRDVKRRARFLARGGAPGDRAADLACRILRSFAGPGGLADRLRRLGPNVLGRELPVLLPVDETPGDVFEGLGASGGGLLPVSHWTGRLDLLYEDVETGEVVVADYKTESVCDLSKEELSAAAAVYEPQLRLYTEAVGRVLRRRLRAEIWFIEASSVVELFHWQPDVSQNGR